MSALKSDEEIERLLSHANNTLNKPGVVVKIIGSGNHGNQDKSDKKAGNQKRDKETQAIVATVATLVGNKVASELFDIGATQVSQYKNGKNASNIPNEDLKNKIDKKLDTINGKIIDKVDILLDIFAEDKMDELKANEIPSAAERLISMFDKIHKRNDKSDGTIKPQVVLYAPKQINITEYVTKEV